MPDILYQDVDATDIVQRGEVYRVGFSRGNLLMSFFSSGTAFGSLWDTGIANTGICFPVSPRPEAVGNPWAWGGGTDSAVIDVKVSQAAPNMSVADFAGKLDKASPFCRVETVQWIDESQSLSIGDAPSQRTAAIKQVQQQRQSRDPLSNYFAQVGSALKIALILVVVVGGAFVAYKVIPRRRETA